MAEHGEHAGWRQLEETRRSLRDRVGHDWPNHQDEINAGAEAAAAALREELCAGCGAAGDPVLIGKRRPSTRCGKCRRPGDRTVPRKWRRENCTERQPASGRNRPDTGKPLDEELRSPEAIEALMLARYAPEDERGWHAGPNSGGWNHLLRAALGVLLGRREDGEREPWRLLSVKRNWGYLEILSTPPSGFRTGVVELVTRLSGTTCLRCGRPGRIRHASGHGVHPACDRCDRQRRDDARKPHGELRRMLRNRARCQGIPIDIEEVVAEARARADALAGTRGRQAGE